VLDEEVGGLEGGAAALSCGGRNGMEGKGREACARGAAYRRGSATYWAGLVGTRFFFIGSLPMSTAVLCCGPRRPKR
jgi:hypothetical protein